MKTNDPKDLEAQNVPKEKYNPKNKYHPDISVREKTHKQALEIYYELKDKKVSPEKLRKAGNEADDARETTYASKKKLGDIQTQHEIRGFFKEYSSKSEFIEKLNSLADLRDIDPEGTHRKLEYVIKNISMHSLFEDVNNNKVIQQAGGYENLSPRVREKFLKDSQDRIMMAPLQQDSGNGKTSLEPKVIVPKLEFELDPVIASAREETKAAQINTQGFGIQESEVKMHIVEPVEDRVKTSIQVQTVENTIARGSKSLSSSLADQAKKLFTSSKPQQAGEVSNPSAKEALLKKGDSKNYSTLVGDSSKGGHSR